MKAKSEPVPRAQISGDTVPEYAKKPIAFNYALRTHYDTLSDEVSNATGLDTGDETPVRQEFAHDADINVLLNKYNVDPRGRPIEFKVDYTLDLQQAIHAVEMAKGTVDHVPPELRNQFPTWQAVLNGAENGSYAAALKDLDDKKQAAKNKAAEAAAQAAASKATNP